MRWLTGWFMLVLAFLCVIEFVGVCRFGFCWWFVTLCGLYSMILAITGGLWWYLLFCFCVLFTFDLWVLLDYMLVIVFGFRYCSCRFGVVCWCVDCDSFLLGLRLHF